MKLCLPSALLALCLGLAPAVQAAYLHHDVSYITYTDFGQNCGRYVVGTTNALLEAIRQEEGGITLTYTGGQTSIALPTSVGMIDYGSLSDSGSVTALGRNTIASAYHVYTDKNLKSRFNPTFTADKLGSAYALQYATVQLATPMQADGTTPADFCMGRMNKVVTDVHTTTVFTGSVSTSTLCFRAGSGVSYRMSTTGTATKLCNDVYTVGGINGVAGYGTDAEYSSSIRLVQNVADWSAAGISTSNPLPTMGATYDSGSATWIYNSTTKQYEYVAAMQGISTADKLTQSMGPTTTWAAAQLSSYDKAVATTGDKTLALSAVSAAGQGTVTGGNSTVTFNGVAAGTHTWKALNAVMNSDTWYAYANTYMNGYGGDMSYLEGTHNLVFQASGTQSGSLWNRTYSSPTVNIQLAETVDLGAGYAEFTKATAQSAAADFIISSGGDGTAVFNHAGYVVNAGVNVHVQLTNSADYAREWRKVGEGNLYIEGSGDNYIGLNLGGSGTTYLNRTGGYAAYNVLANTGATVVLQDVKQIARDFTFGNGGGVLDFNGNSMVWNNSAAVADDGFTIHALTEEAVIANNGSGVSTLTIKNAGTSFLGSFLDSATGALQVVYAGSGTLNWHGIVTDLSHHADSGITVQSGTLSLSGTNTVHGQGSATGKTAARYTNADDWHYADAAAKVTVQNGGTFELGSHARLIGNVAVEEGGTFVMHEGVLHEQEYLEGGQMLQSTAAIATFYGLKGNVELAQGAVMQADISSAATVATEYGGNISGEGSLTKVGGGTLHLSGTVALGGGLTVQEGCLALDAVQRQRVNTVAAGAELVLGGVSITSADAVQDVELSGFLWSAEGSTAELRAEEQTELAHALVDLAADTTLHLENVLLTADTRITDAPAAVSVNNVGVQAVMGQNMHLLGTDTLAAGTPLTLCGGSGETLTTESPATLTELRLDTLSDVDIRGTAWSITLSDWENSLVAHTDWVAVTLGLEGQEATLSSAVTVTLTLAGLQESLQGYVLQDGASTVYFNVAPAVPEPTTATLSLLALAALAARRRKR